MVLEEHSHNEKTMISKNFFHITLYNFKKTGFGEKVKKIEKQALVKRLRST